MGTIRRMAGIEKKVVGSAATTIDLGIEGAAIGAIYLPAASPLAGAVTLEIAHLDKDGSEIISGPLADDTGAAIGMTLTADQVNVLPPSALVGQTLRLVFGAAPGADAALYLLTKT